MSGGKRPEPKMQGMPMDRAILWNPPAAPGSTNPGRPSSRSPYPIFFQQEAVIALQEHLKSSPTQAIFGFLIGDVYRDPETGVLYTVIDKTLKLSQPIYGDKTEVVVSRLWDRMQEQLGKASASLLGWYHSHPGQGGFLTPHDVETHEKFFTEPWHVAVLMAAEAGGVTGRFFRATQTNDWHKTPVAFYELLQPDSIKPDGKKRSFITWRNYKAYGPSLTGPKPPKAPPPPEPEPAPPKDQEPEEEQGQEESPPPPRAKRTDAGDKGFRIMRSSADDIPVIRTSADDEPAPAPEPPEPVPPPPPLPPPPPPPPPPPRAKKEPEAPVIVPPADERSELAAPRPEPKTGDLPWAVTPESVASVPPPVFPPPPAPPQEPRRTPTHTFRLLEQDTEPALQKPKRVQRRRRRSGPWLSRALLLVVIAGASAGGYWYFTHRKPGVPPPWSGLLDRAKKLVSRSASPPPPSRGGTTRRPSPVAQPPAASSAPAPFTRFDRLSDSLARAVRNYRDRADLFGSGRIDCSGLAAGLAAVESLWNVYNAERRARMANFDQRRALQDQAMYASVDSVESRFEQSGCRRP